MKLRNLFMAVIAGAFALTACEELPEDLVSPLINLDPSELEFDASEGTKTIDLTATLNWSVVTDLSGKWVALGKDKGDASKDKQTISVSVEANTGFDRTMDIVFSAGNMVKATLKVTQKGSQGTFVAEEGDGSKEKPYNVAQVAEAVAQLTWTDKDTYEKVGPFYVKGKIASIKEAFSSAYGNGTFTITDDGNATDPSFTAYRIYYLENKKWVEGNTQIEVGDVVVVYGEIMNYMGNTPETVQKGSYLYSLNGETVATGGQTVDYANAEAKTVAEFIAAADTKTPYKLTGEVTGNINTTYGNFDLKDATGTIKIYGVSNWADVQDKVKKGSIITIAGVYKDYNGTHEMVDGYILDVQGGQEVDYNSVPAKTVAEFISAADTGNYYKLTGKVSGFNANYCSFDLTDETGLIYVYSVDNKSDWSSKIKDGGTVTLAGLYAYYSAKNQHEVVNAHILSFTEGESGPAENATGNGTLDNPYNPKAAADVASALEDKAKTENDVYVKGKISSVKYTFSAQYGTATFYISEDGTTSGTQFQVYSVYYLGNRAWVDGDTQVAVGDEVIICGKLTNYGGTPETSSKEAYIYSLNGATDGGSQQTETEQATGNGTLDNPYNPKAAADVASALEDKAKTENDVYVKGKISSVKYTFSAQYGTATFFISEDGTTSGTQFQVYSVYYLGNRAWVDGDTQVAVGDEVIICGKLTNYGGTPETSSKEAYIYSLNGATGGEPAASFGVEKTEISVAATATGATIKVTGNVAWTATSTAVIEGGTASGNGAGSFSVAFDENTDTENVKTYTATVVTTADVANKEIVVTITQAKASSGNTNVITIPLTSATTFAEDNGGDVLKNGWAATVEGYKVATYKYKSTSNPITPDQYSMRVYKSAVFYIEAPAGKTIKALCFKANNYDNGKYILDLTGVEGTEGTAVADKTDAIIKWEGSASTVTLQAAAGQTRLESVEVYFE